MQKYNIIIDEKELQDYINWFPELEDGEKFYCCLFARKKYDTKGALKADKNQLKRFVSDKKHLLQKIKQLEVEYGNYTFGTVPIEQETLALYINPNPRSTHKASLKLMSDICNKLGKGETIYNPHSMSLNALQNTASRKIYFDIDIDFKEGQSCSLEEIITFCEGKVNLDALTIIQTRGGFHLLVELGKLGQEFIRRWYVNFSTAKDGRFSIMMNSDNLIPVVGCTQGCFVPKKFRAQK